MTYWDYYYGSTPSADQKSNLVTDQDPATLTWGGMQNLYCRAFNPMARRIMRRCHNGVAVAVNAQGATKESA